MTAAEKAEILELVRKSPFGVRETLETLGVPRSTYYRWLSRRRSYGFAGLEDRKPVPGRVWNKLPGSEVETVLEYAHRHTDQSSRELAWKITDEAGFSVSESTVYRVLKRNGLIQPAVVESVKAAKEYHRKTTRVHELWQTDLTYFFIVGWGWYYVGGILDDYSRYLLTLRVVRDMTGPTLSDLVQEAVEASGMENVPVERKVKLLSDNGAGYISGPFNEYLAQVRIGHIYAARLHPQTVGKFERLNRTAKDRLGLVIYGSPRELESAVEEFKDWYNHERYHEGIGNLRPMEVYEGRAEEILAKRKEVQARTIERRRQWNLCLTDGVEEGNLDTCGVN